MCEHMQAPLESFLFIFYTSELLCIIGNHIVGNADDITINAFIPRLFSGPQAMESLNQDLAAIYSWCLRWHMRLNPKKIKYMVVSRSRIYAPGNGNLTLAQRERYCYR